MTKQINTLVHKPVVSIWCLALLTFVTTAAQRIGSGGAATKFVVGSTSDQWKNMRRSK